MAITALQVKELREKTGAGMMDCKKALTECDGDMAKASDWLREKGIAKAAKKQGRIAAEGLSRVLVKNNRCCLIEINSETDFVAKNDKFLALLDLTAETLVDSNVTSVEDALKLPVGSETLNDEFINAIAVIGEKITLRRFTVLEKKDDEIFGTYMHMGGSISSAVIVRGTQDGQVAKDMAMQVASMNPGYVSREEMPQDAIAHERTIQQELAKNDETLKNKPEKILVNIVEGRLSKSLQDMCLVDQIYFKNQEIKCRDYLKENNAEVVKFVRYAVGEGIEKREENFAEEVAAQINK